MTNLDNQIEWIRCNYSFNLFFGSVKTYNKNYWCKFYLLIWFVQLFSPRQHLNWWTFVILTVLTQWGVLLHWRVRLDDNYTEMIDNHNHSASLNHTCDSVTVWQHQSEMSWSGLGRDIKHSEPMPRSQCLTSSLVSCPTQI